MLNNTSLAKRYYTFGNIAQIFKKESLGFILTLLRFIVEMDFASFLFFFLIVDLLKDWQVL